jgi:L-glyceraldehyde 3-phosphate reductase
MFDRWIEGGLLDVLAEEGVGCIVFSPLAQGLLTDKYLVGIPAGSRASKPHGFLRPEQITGDKLVKVQKLSQVARARGQTLAQMALAWNLRYPAVTSVLVGASQVAQLEDNVAALNKLDFSQQELAAIEQILAA